MSRTGFEKKYKFPIDIFCVSTYNAIKGIAIQNVVSQYEIISKANAERSVLQSVK